MLGVPIKNDEGQTEVPKEKIKQNPEARKKRKITHFNPPYLVEHGRPPEVAMSYLIISVVCVLYREGYCFQCNYKPKTKVLIFMRIVCALCTYQKQGF